MTTLEPQEATPLTAGENPFKEIRLAHGLTQVQIANHASVSKHAVIRNEQGCAVEPLPKLLNYFASTFPIDVYTLRSAYEQFQISQRAKAGRLLGNINSILRVRTTKEHPLTYLRLTVVPPLNPTSLSVALCLNQSVINHFESQPIHQKTVPEQLLVALKQAGYTDSELDTLCLHYGAYREQVLGLRRL